MTSSPAALAPAPTSSPVPADVEPSISLQTTLLLAAACALVVGNIYYAQPLIGPIAASLGLSSGAAGLVVTMTQIGYGLGLLFVVPLGDLIENRRLVLILLAAVALALLAAASSTQALSFLAALLLVGICSVAVQILVVYAAHLAPAAVRGRVVGNVTGAIMLGIMLARPAASFVTDLLSWRAVFFLSAALMAVVGTALAFCLPPRRAAPGLGYGALLASMARLARTTPVLRRRALYHAAMFGAFSLFWTTVPLVLAGPDYRLSQTGIALFALAGVAGAIAGPIGGRIADRGWSRPATGLAMLVVVGAFLLTHIGRPGSPLALGCLVVAAILVDFGVTTNLVLGQRAIFTLAPEHRSRLNGLYMATFFAGGAIGSAAGAWAYAQAGWMLVTWIGFALPIAALAYYATERRSLPHAA